MIKYYLAENHFSKEQQDFVAHVVNSKVYDMDSVVEHMLSMGAPGTKMDILNVLSSFNKSLAQIIKSGSTVNLPFLRTSFSISGIFNGTSDSFDHKRHKIHINNRTPPEIKALAVDVTAHKVEPSAIIPNILEVVDNTTGSTNNIITPGGMLSIEGKYLKIDGDSNEIGIFFKNLHDKSHHKASIIGINKPSLLMLTTPNLNMGKYQLKIVTQYRSRDGKTGFTKTPREGIFNKILTVR